MEDSVIIELYWQREEAAIGETEKKYGSYCRAIALRILSDPEDAEECVNDTWHHAWRSIPPERPNSLAAFLGRIVRNLSISRWRKEHAQKRFSGLEALLSELEDCLPDSAGVEATVEGRALTKSIEEWLTEQSCEDRAVFLRRYWYGEKVQELAEVWGISPNRMTKRLSGLRKNLKKKLEKEGFSI